VVKTTLYLPEDLKESLEREARRRATSEASLIREAIAAALAGVERPKPVGGVIKGAWEPVDWDGDDWLEGFGAR
jgi:hypothetical protein